MGCSPCEQKRREREAAALAAAQAGQSLTIEIVGNGCNYDISQLTKWKQTLDCGYTSNKLEAVNLTEEMYGLYIGAINYTIDHIGDPDCIYSNELALILNIVHILVALGC